MCRYESLIDGTLDLFDIALMNDKLACDHDNEQLYKQHQQLKESRNG